MSVGLKIKTQTAMVYDFLNNKNKVQITGTFNLDTIAYTVVSTDRNLILYNTYSSVFRDV